VLPQELFDEVQRIAAAWYSTVVEVLRQFIRLGLLVAQTERFTKPACIYRQGSESLRIHLSSILTQENHPWLSRTTHRHRPLHRPRRRGRRTRRAV
jgi:hypothetical protein